MFTDRALHDVEQQQYRRLGGMLGTYWTQESVQSLLEPPDPHEIHKPRTAISIPLLLGMVPQLQETLRRSFGAPYGITPPEWYVRHKGEVVEGAAMDRDKFIQLAGLFTGHIPKGYQRSLPNRPPRSFSTRGTE